MPNIIFGGRLADYAYYDMDMTIPLHYRSLKN